MKLLILTQKVDVNDPILGFFHRWIEEFAKHFEAITVICLQKGEYELPENVRVFSLGKEKLTADSYKLSALRKIKYAINFYKHIWKERRNYDVVFVHMNQEYVLLGGIFWKIFGKKIYMWRNHHAGSFLTDIAAAFCAKVFCTSKYSYTAKYKKTVLMPVGVDTNKFVKSESLKVRKVKNSILFLGRIAPSKNVHIFVEALGLLKERNIYFTADIYGNASRKDIPYLEKIKSRARELGLEGVLKFHGGVANRQTPEIYNSHEIFVNLSSSGMYDKTIFEAMACGCLVLASNDNLKGQIDGMLIIEERKAEEVATQISLILSLSEDEKQRIISNSVKFAETHSLSDLSLRFAEIARVSYPKRA